MCSSLMFFFFFFNDTATTEIYTLSLHNALPISLAWLVISGTARVEHVLIYSFLTATINAFTSPARQAFVPALVTGKGDRKSTRLNSSHLVISYAVFCLKKKNNHT